ncbi:hypothetical protein F4810DRAFT_715810 [Camillea tinctor]|nr:hypothetical protein F4810DRAFT_715810 [Camillea tinctor]
MLPLDILLVFSVLPGLCFSKTVPENLWNLYVKIKSFGQCMAYEEVGYCSSSNSSVNTFGYCGDMYKYYRGRDFGVIYIQGNQNRFADMSVT